MTDDDLIFVPCGEPTESFAELDRLKDLFNPGIPPHLLEPRKTLHCSRPWHDRVLLPLTTGRATPQTEALARFVGVPVLVDLPDDHDPGYALLPDPGYSATQSRGLMMQATSRLARLYGRGP